jgi:hypothetical protein
MANRCADVYIGFRVSVRSLSEFSVCSPADVVGGAWVSRRDAAPLRFVYPGGVGEAMAATVLWNKCSRPLPRPGDELLRHQRRGRGAVLRRQGLVSRLLAILLAFLLFKVAEMAVGVRGWWPAGSGSTSPRRRWLSMASPNLGVGGVGALPRSMGDRRGLLQLRLQQKPVCDGASPARGRPLLRRCWPTARWTTAVEDSRRV